MLVRTVAGRSDPRAKVENIVTFHAEIGLPALAALAPQAYGGTWPRAP
jgi:hypothetical protein